MDDTGSPRAVFLRLYFWPVHQDTSLYPRNLEINRSSRFIARGALRDAEHNIVNALLSPSFIPLPLNLTRQSPVSLPFTPSSLHIDWSESYIT